MKPFIDSNQSARTPSTLSYATAKSQERLGSHQVEQSTKSTGLDETPSANSTLGRLINSFVGWVKSILSRVTGESPLTSRSQSKIFDQGKMNYPELIKNAHLLGTHAPHEDDKLLTQYLKGLHTNHPQEFKNFTQEVKRYRSQLNGRLACLKSVADCGKQETQELKATIEDLSKEVAGLNKLLRHTTHVVFDTEFLKPDFDFKTVASHLSLKETIHTLDSNGMRQRVPHAIRDYSAKHPDAKLTAIRNNQLGNLTLHGADLAALLNATPNHPLLGVLGKNQAEFEAIKPSLYIPSDQKDFRARDLSKGMPNYDEIPGFQSEHPTDIFHNLSKISEKSTFAKAVAKLIPLKSPEKMTALGKALEQHQASLTERIKVLDLSQRMMAVEGRRPPQVDTLIQSLKNEQTGVRRLQKQLDRVIVQLAARKTDNQPVSIDNTIEINDNREDIQEETQASNEGMLSRAEDDEIALDEAFEEFLANPDIADSPIASPADVEDFVKKSRT